MNSGQLHDLSRQLEDVYRELERERMQDVPVLNQALSVKAVGFREREGHIIGVMVTPWFMNLMMLPGESDDWSDLEILSKTRHTFPSGHYEFIVGKEEGIGIYQSCSLFSPVFEFKDQETAVMTAEAVMQELMDETNRSDVSTRQEDIENIWRGDKTLEDVEMESEYGNDTTKPGTSPGERARAPMSRRDLLRGRFLFDQSEQE